MPAGCQPSPPARGTGPSSPAPSCPGLGRVSESPPAPLRSRRPLSQPVGPPDRRGSARQPGACRRAARVMCAGFVARTGGPARPFGRLSKRGRSRFRTRISNVSGKQGRRGNATQAFPFRHARQLKATLCVVSKLTTVPFTWAEVTTMAEGGSLYQGEVGQEGERLAHAGPSCTGTAKVPRERYGLPASYEALFNLAAIRSTGLSYLCLWAFMFFKPLLKISVLQLQGIA